MRSTDENRQLRRTGYRLSAATDVLLAALPGQTPARLRRITKPLLMPTLAAAVLLDQRPAAGQRSAALTGIGLSGIGDVSLLGSGDSAFITGLGAFLGAHLSYAVGFARDGGLAGLRRAPVRAFPALVVVGFGAVALLPRAGALRIPVAGYTAVIGAMAALAAGTGRRDAAVGAALFCASDLLLGWCRFRGAPGPGRLADAVVMATYAAGQEAIARSLTTHRPRSGGRAGVGGST